MSKCTLCGKSSIVRGGRKLLRGHYNPTGKRRRYPNVQSVTLPSGRSVRACTQCQRTQSKHAQ